MKKIMIIVSCLLVLTGCTTKKEKRLEQMEQYGKGYYQKYGSQYEVDEYFVSLKNLKDANEFDQQKYDLKIFDKCSNNTSVTFQIKDKKIKSFKIKLDC